MEIDLSKYVPKFPIKGMLLMKYKSTGTGNMVEDHVIMFDGDNWVPYDPNQTPAHSDNGKPPKPASR